MFGRCAPQAAKAAFLKEAFGLSLALADCARRFQYAIESRQFVTEEHPERKHLMTNLISMEIDSIGTQPRLTHADLRHFSGDLERYFHPLNRNVLYTPGVKYVAEVGQAYWLIDAIASYFGSTEMNEAMQLDSRLIQP